MLKILILVAAMMTASSSLASDYPSLVFEMADGNNITLPSDGLTMEFNGSLLVASVGGTLIDIPVEELSKFYFSSDISGVLEVSGVAEECDSVRVFTAAGVYVGEFPSTNEARTNLQSGIYIIKSAHQTSKTVIK